MRDEGTDSVGSIHDGDLCICSTNLNVVVLDFFSDVDRQGRVRPFSCRFIVHSGACV